MSTGFIIIISAIAIIAIILIIMWVMSSQAKKACDDTNSGVIGHWMWGQTDAWWRTQPQSAQMEYYANETAKKKNVTLDQVKTCYNKNKSSSIQQRVTELNMPGSI